MGSLLLGGPHLSVGEIGVSTMSEALSLTIDSVELLGTDIWVVATPPQSQGKE